MAIESACIPFPSEVIMPLAGWLLVDDKGRGVEWLFIGAFFGALGNTSGSLVAYYAGAWGGRPLLDKYGKYVLITRKDVDLSRTAGSPNIRRDHGPGEPSAAGRSYLYQPARRYRQDGRQALHVLTFVGSYFVVAWR